MLFQLPLFIEPTTPLPYGTCPVCRVRLDWRTLPRLYGLPVWPRCCPTCGAAAGFSLWGPDRPDHRLVRS